MVDQSESIPITETKLLNYIYYVGEFQFGIVLVKCGTAESRIWDSCGTLRKKVNFRALGSPTETTYSDRICGRK